MYSSYGLIAFLISDFGMLKTRTDYVRDDLDLSSLQPFRRLEETKEFPSARLSRRVNPLSNGVEHTETRNEKSTPLSTSSTSSPTTSAAAAAAAAAAKKPVLPHDMLLQEIKVIELEGVVHRAMLKDDTTMDVVLEFVTRKNIDSDDSQAID